MVDYPPSPLSTGRQTYASPVPITSDAVPSTRESHASMPSPEDRRTQLTVHRPDQQPAPSPMPSLASPYPTARLPARLPARPPQSSPTEEMDRDDPPPQEIPPEYEEFLRWRQAQRQGQALPPQSPPQQPTTVTQGSNYRTQQVLRRGPMDMQPVYRQDSGYVQGPYDNLGQAHGLPGQYPRPIKQGHNFGKITVKGNARVIRGNVLDGTRPNPYVVHHNYGEVEIDDEAKIADGDQTIESARDFWNAAVNSVQR